MQDVYVVLMPKGQANPTDTHLVVRVDEYVKVHLGELDEYTVANEHNGYDDAAADRDHLNGLIREKAAA